jgi:DNA primase
MFPIIDVRGNVIGFGGRVLDDSTPKYLNTSETLIFNKRKNLFGLNFAKKRKEDYIILVEGNIDVITLHQYGFDTAVASLGTSLTEEHAALLSRYTEQVVLTYDGDEAGQRAAKRAIPMLEKVGIKVKVLQMRDAKDPDEFLHKFGPEAFRALLGESSNRVEYQLNAIRRKYDLGEDAQRIQFIQEAAELIATLGSPVQREVYGGRVADAGKITLDAMKLEINKAFKRRVAMQRKAQEKIDLAPARALQPKSRTIRYDNVKSAVAEEGIVSLAIQEPALLDLAADLRPEEFSVELLGKVYSQLQQRHKEGLGVSVAVLSELTPEETSHITAICQRREGPVSETAFRDCVNIVKGTKQASAVSSDDDLMAFRNKLRQSKGTKQ